jgi:hypothetical protein
MPKAKNGAGNLILKRHGWCARYTEVVDGVSVRRYVQLGTHDKAVAKGKLANLIQGKTTPEREQRTLRRLKKQRGESSLPKV